MRVAQSSKVSTNAETGKVDRQLGQIHDDKKLQDTQDKTRQDKARSASRGYQ